MCRCPLSREEQPGTRGTHTDREAGESEREGWGDARSAPAWSVQQGAHGWVGEPCVETSGVGFQRDNQESLPAQRAKNQDQPGSRRTEEGGSVPSWGPKADSAPGWSGAPTPGLSLGRGGPRTCRDARWQPLVTPRRGLPATPGDLGGIRVPADIPGHPEFSSLTSVRCVLGGCKSI